MIEVLDEVADLVVGQRGDHAGAQAEDLAHAAGHVVLTAALPRLEAAGGADPPLPRVEAQHHLAERDDVELALVGRDGSRSCGWLLGTRVEVGRRRGRSRRRSGRRPRPSGRPRAGRRRPSSCRRRRRRTGGPGRPGALSTVIPPVGMKRTWGKAAASALIVARPPLASAGKNFTVSRPRSRACMISLGVLTPGITGTPASWQRRTTARAEARRHDEPRTRLDAPRRPGGR